MHASNRYWNFGFLILLLTFAASAFTDASYYTQMYGQQPFAPQTSGNGGYFSFPVYSGSYQEQNQRNRQDVNQLFDQSDSFTDTTQLFDAFRSRDTTRSFRSLQNLQDLQEYGNVAQSNTNYDSGSMSYSVGDGNQLTSYRELEFNGRGKRNDVRIKEWIYGGEQVKYAKNFGSTNNYLTNAGFNQRAYTNDLFSGASSTDVVQNRQTQNNRATTNTLNNRYSLQQASFGSGFSIVFNQ